MEIVKMACCLFIRNFCHSGRKLNNYPVYYILRKEGLADDKTKKTYESLSGQEISSEADWKLYKPEVLEALQEAKTLSQDPDYPRFNSWKEALKDMGL